MPINAGVLIVSLLAVLLLSDFFLRVLYTIPGKGYSLVSKPAGSRLIFESRPDNFRAEHRYNSFGARGPEFPLVPERTYRIACIGDSFTEGLGAAEDRTWPAALARLLADRDAEALNLGKGGERPRGYSRIFASVALPLKVTDAVVCFLPNDFLKIRVARGLRPGAPFRDPFMEREALWQREAARWIPGWTYVVERVLLKKWNAPLRGMMQLPFTENLVQRTVRAVGRTNRIPPEAAARLVNQRVSEIPGAVLDAAREGRFSPAAIQYELVQPGASYRLRLQDLAEPPEVIEASLSAWLTWYRDTGRRFGVRCWVLYFPQAPLVADGNFGVWPDGHPVHRVRSMVFGDTSLRDLLRQTCGRIDIPFIDATETLTANRDKDLFLRFDTHPTPLAYGLVAEEVTRQMSPVLR